MSSKKFNWIVGETIQHASRMMNVIENLSLKTRLQSYSTHLNSAALFCNEIQSLAVVSGVHFKIVMNINHLFAWFDHMGDSRLEKDCCWQHVD